VKKQFSAFVWVAGLAALATAAYAAALPAPFGPAAAGASVSYRYKGNLDSPKGLQSFDQTIGVSRAADGTLSVLQGTTALGSVSAAGVATPDAKTPTSSYFNGFRDIAALVQNRPADVAEGATWKATLPVPWGSQLLAVPMDVSAKVDGDSVTLTAHGTLATTVPPPAYVAEADLAITADETAQYSKGALSSATISHSDQLSMNLVKHQGNRTDSYSARYDITVATP
jgi:hypothetical protein